MTLFDLLDGGLLCWKDYDPGNAFAFSLSWGMFELFCAAAALKAFAVMPMEGLRR